MTRAAARLQQRRRLSEVPAGRRVLPLDLLRAFLYLALSFASVTESLAEQQRLTLRDVTLLPPDAPAPQSGMTIAIEDDRIVAVGPDGSIPATVGERTIDGAGRFVLPGLCDLHVHIKRSRRDLDRLFPLFLAHGVTTVLNLDGGPAVLRAREQVRNGELLGPTIYTSGPIIRGSESMTREQGEKVADDHIAAGYDLVKVYNPISEAGYEGIVARARAAGVPVIGHAVRSVGIEGALESGQHIAHMEEVVYGYFTWRSRDRDDLPEDVVARLDVLLDPAKIPDLAGRVKQAGIFVIPNLTAYHNIELQVGDLEKALARPEVALMPESMTRSWQRDRNEYTNRPDPPRFLRGLRRTFPFLQQLTAAFEQAGVPLLAGTDVGIPVIVAGASLHDELQELVDAGLSPQQAIATATVNAARFLGRKDAGRIAAGQVADLVLLRADPFADIANVRTVEAVVVRGRLIGRTELDRMLAVE